MKMLKIKRINKLTAFLLAAAVVISTVTPALILSYFASPKAEAAANDVTYVNPYIATENTALDFPGAVTGGTEPSEVIADEDAFKNLALYSQSNTLTGTYNITTTAASFNLGADFCGIGSADHPFSGTLVYSYQETSSLTINLNNCGALFNYLSSSASVLKINIVSGDSVTGRLANYYVLENQTAGTLSSVTLSGSAAAVYKNQDAGLLFGTVIASATLPVQSTTLSLSGVTMNAGGVSALDGSSGGLIGRIKTGANLTVNDGQFSFDSDYSVSSTGGDAGMLAGTIETGASLTVNGAVTVTGDGSAEKIRANAFYDTANSALIGGNAGGIVGRIASGSTFTANSVAVTNQVIGGANSVGGVAGLNDNGTIAVTGSTAVSGTTAQGGVSCGGYVGLLNNPSSAELSASNITLSSVIIPTDDARFGVAAGGGIFGSLKYSERENGTTFAVSSTAASRVTVEFKNVSGSGTDADAAAGKDNIAIGGIIGNYKANSLSDSLAISGGCTSSYTSSSGVGFYGGVVGLISGNSYCKIDSLSESVSTADIYAMNFGGLAGKIDDGAALDASAVTVSGGFSAKYAEAYAGGFVGYTGRGSVLRLSGSTTLGTTAVVNTGSGYAKYCGQIAGYQESSLIFAESDWSLVRGSADRRADDIGNYGEVIRNGGIGSCISFDSATHTVGIASPLAFSNSEITLSTPSDYAKLAITLNSRGVFSAVNGISTANYANLLSSEITIDEDISLNGTGIVTLTRNDTETDAFSGTVEGGNHIVTLAIGEKYSMGGANGNGEIFAQPYLGMFGAISGATVNNLTVSGNIINGQFESGAKTNDRTMYVGGIAGSASGAVTLNNVKTQVIVTEKNSRSSQSNNSCYGGLIGQYKGSGLTSTGCTDESEITIVNNHTESFIHTGGFIGDISSTIAGDIKFDKATLSGTIKTSGGSTAAEVMAGGLVGCVTASGVDPNQVKILINGITSTASQKVITNASSVSGSLLGYNWSNVEVLMDKHSDGTANTISGALASTGGANFGGLFYKIEGKLAVKNTTVNGAFSGSNINSNKYDGIVVRDGTNMYMTVEKATVAIAPSSASSWCDDLVGTNMADLSSGKFGGIVSIQTSVDGTATGAADPIGSTEHPWTYSTTAGVTNKGPNTRYYYNVEGLDYEHYAAGFNRVSGGTISSADDLLLWHILNYTSNDSCIKAAFFFSNSGVAYPKNKNYTVSAQNAELDLSNACIYPTTVTGGEYNFNGANLKFDNALVNTYLPENAKTTDAAAQHRLMQTGLFFDVNSNLSVSNLTLSGNVGMTANGSGAIITGTISGSHNGTISYTVYTVELNGIIADNLYINGNTGSNYAPLFINKVRTCATVNMTDVAVNYTNAAPEKAGSSLIGDVGFTGVNDNGTHLNLAFSQMVINGEKSSSPLYTASFLNSFAYATDGSSGGIYNFTLAEDWNNDGTHNNQVTYGKELTANDTEYFDKSLFVRPDYNPETGSNVKYDYTGATAGENEYLPYVASGSIRVNLKGGDLTIGCGTYEDPYVIDTADQLQRIADYINKGTLSSGWQVNYPKDSFCDNKADHSEYVAGTSGFTYNDVAGGTDNSAKITRTWFSHAYYLLNSDITLSSESEFIGLGVDSMPFAGVISGGHTITIPKTAAEVAQLGFVNVAAGCVLKDMTIKYSTGFTMKNPGTSKTNTYYFGGAIGKIIGGDNILDGVSVELPEITVTSRLNYVGGYVGLDMAGGVIFKHMSTIQGGVFKDSSGNEVQEDNDLNYFYTNPFVGRVLDGFAVVDYDKDRDGDTVYTIDNTDKNYTIPTLKGTLDAGSGEYIKADDVKVSYTGLKGTRYYNTITITNEEGLFVFSAALNCGALSTGYSAAYSGEARRRTAEYDKLGNISNSSDEDYTLSKRDNVADGTNSNAAATQESVPYLCANFMTNITTGTNAKYSAPNYLTGYGRRSIIAINSPVNIIDMTSYGSGFRGIGGRYKTKANALNGGADGGSPDRNRTLTEDYDGSQYSFNGGGSAITMNTQLRQYDTEQYSTPFSGLFIEVNNGGENTKKSTYCNATLSGTSSIQQYKLSDGSENPADSYSYYAGALISSFTNQTSQKQNENQIVVKSVKLDNMNVSSPGLSGGMIGFIKTRASVSVLDCSFDNLNVLGKTNVGGLIGNSTVPVTVTNTAESSYQNAIITNNGTNSSGGLIGSASSSVVVTSSDSSVVTPMSNVTLTGAANRGNAGGIIGYASLSTVDINNISLADCKISADNADNNAGGLVGNSETSSVSLSNVSVSNTDIVSLGNAGGLAGQVKSNYFTVNKAVVNGVSIISNSTGKSAGGAVGYSTVDSTITDMTVDSIENGKKTVISAAKCGGIAGNVTGVLNISGSHVDNSLDNNTSVKNSVIYGTTSSGGLFGECGSSAPSYLNNITVSNNTICSNSSSNNIGGISGKISTNLYGSNIIWDGNAMGVSDASYNITKNSGAVWVKTVGGTVYFTAISRQNSGTGYTECGGSNNILVYADYSGTSAVSDAETEGSHIPVSPSVTLGGNNLYSDGISAGTPGKIFSEKSTATVNNRYSNTGLTSSSALGADKILTGNDYLSGVSDAVSTLPILDVSGDIDVLISQYADLLTNGGFSKRKSYLAANPSATDLTIGVSSRRYTAAGNTVTAGAADSGSVSYNNGSFVASQNYDAVKDETLTFTVVTVDFDSQISSDGSKSTYSMSFAIYYKQVLDVTSSIYLADHEEYNITKFGTTTNVNVISGGVFTAYVEYVYNDVRSSDDWNYDKYINAPNVLPKGTVITLVDLNTVDADGQVDSTGFRAYYSTLSADSSVIKLSDMKNISNSYLTGNKLTDLKNLPAYNDLYTPDSSKEGFGVERYLIVFDLPENTGTDDRYIYRFIPDIDETAGTDKNVELTYSDHGEAAVTAWKQATITSSVAASSAVIARATPIEAQANVKIDFPDLYISSVENLAGSDRYGVVRYYIADPSGKRIVLPSGTAVSIGGQIISADGTQSYFDSVISDASGNPINLIKNTSNNSFSYSQPVSVDFSNVSSAVLKDLFPGSQYTLHADFYMTSDQNYPSIGQVSNSSTNLTVNITSGATLSANVDADSLLHLGINPLDINDNTNDGTIKFNVIVDISECNDEEIAYITENPGNAKLNFQLSKKNSSNEYSDVSMEDYLNSALGQQTLTIANYNQTTKQYFATYEISVKTASEEQLSYFSNYKLEVSAELKIGDLTVTPRDHFIYTLARIPTDFLGLTG